MPSEETAVEEKPKGPPVPDESIEDALEKLTLQAAAEECKIPLQSPVNQSAKELEDLISPPTEDKSTQERGLDDVDGYLDQVQPGPSRGWSTNWGKGQRPPPPYPGVPVAKYSKEQANFQTRQLRYTAISSSLPHHQRAFRLSPELQSCHGNGTFEPYNHDPTQAYYEECNPPNMTDEELLQLAIVLSESESSNGSLSNSETNTSPMHPDVNSFNSTQPISSTPAAVSVAAQPFLGDGLPMSWPPTSQFPSQIPLPPPSFPTFGTPDLNSQVHMNPGISSDQVFQQVQNGYQGSTGLYGQSNGIEVNGESRWNETRTQTSLSQALPSDGLDDDGGPSSMPYSEFQNPEISSQIPTNQALPHGKYSGDGSNYQKPQNSTKSDYRSSPSWIEQMSNCHETPKIIPVQESSLTDHLVELYKNVEKNSALNEIPDLVDILTNGDNPVQLINENSHQSNGSAVKIQDGSAAMGDNSNMINVNQNIPSSVIVPNSPMVESTADAEPDILDSPPASPYADTSETIAHHLVFLEPGKMSEFCQKHGEVVQEHINSQNQYHQTPLYMAVKRRNYDAVDMCLHFGADPSIQGKDEKSGVMEAPLHVAIGNDDHWMVDRLLKCPHIDSEQQRVYDRKTPLMLALHGHNITAEEEKSDTRRLIIRMLVEREANLHKLDEQSDKTVFMLTIETGDLVLIKYLLEYVTVDGSRELINRANRAGNTSFHIAAGLRKLDEEDQLELLKVLVYYGGNTDALNLDNRTPKDWKKNLFDKMKHSPTYQPEDDD